MSRGWAGSLASHKRTCLYVSLEVLVRNTLKKQLVSRGRWGWPLLTKLMTKRKIYKKKMSEPPPSSPADFSLDPHMFCYVFSWIRLRVQVRVFLTQSVFKNRKTSCYLFATVNSSQMVSKSFKLFYSYHILPTHSVAKSNKGK